MICVWWKQAVPTLGLSEKEDFGIFYIPGVFQLTSALYKWLIADQNFNIYRSFGYGSFMNFRIPFSNLNDWSHFKIILKSADVLDRNSFSPNHE